MKEGRTEEESDEEGVRDGEKGQPGRGTVLRALTVFTQHQGNASIHPLCQKR